MILLILRFWDEIEDVFVGVFAFWIFEGVFGGLALVSVYARHSWCGG